MPRKKSKQNAQTGTKRTINKSAFVRALPATLSASDVLAKAKAEGITLSKAQVYTIRANARVSARKGGPRKTRGPAKAQKAARGASSQEAQFAKLVIDLGFSKANALLARLRQSIENALN